MQPQQEHLEIFQWIGLETAELLPAYITRYYNNLHHQVNQQSHLRASDIIAWDYEYIYVRCIELGVLCGLKWGRGCADHALAFHCGQNFD